MKNARLIWISLCVAAGAAWAQSSQPIQRKIGFSGFVDGDFSTDLGSRLSDPTHTTGLEVDLTTAITFTPRISAFIRTTLNDGAVPSQGAGNTWDDLNFDGVEVNWRYTHQTTLLIGDLTSGSGYFNYYLYKRSAALVSEETVRGAGFRSGGLEVHTGVARDSASPSGNWATYLSWRQPINKLVTWTPSLRYTAGTETAAPLQLGLSFEGRLEGVIEVNAHFGLNYWNNERDAGTVVLIEPRYSFDRYYLAGSLFYNDKGEVPGNNVARQTVTGLPLDDFVFYVEPGMALNKAVSAGLPLEFHNARLTAGGDESFWVAPTLYVTPARGAQWMLWTRMVTPYRNGPSPTFGLGSEISYRF